MFLVAVTHGAIEDTTPSVFHHLRRHLLSASDVPSPANAAGILTDHPDRANFLRDGVPEPAHHPARPIAPLFP